MKWTLLVLMAVMSLSCGVSINYDYATGTDFSKYKTYAYYNDLDSGLSEFDQRRLLRGLDHYFTALGLEKRTNPDFIIDIKGEVYQRQSNSSVGIGVGGTSGNVGGGVGVSVPVNNNQTYDEMLIRFVDKETEATIWQADLNVILSTADEPEERDKYFMDLASKILKKYPPKSKKDTK